MPPLNFSIVILLGAAMMALAIAQAGILRRALHTGLLKKGNRYFKYGSWSRTKNPIAFRFMWSLGVASALGLFAFGAFFCFSSVAMFLGYWK